MRSYQNRLIQETSNQKTTSTLYYEIQTGTQIDTAMRSLFKSADAYGMERYVNGLAKRLGEYSPVYYPYTIVILDDERSAYAFSAPGGFIYISKGLLEMTESESQLVALLATQMAHISQRHVYKLPQVMDSNLTGTFFQSETEAFNELTPEQRQAFRWAHTLIYQSYLETEMLEAYELATRMMVQANYDPAGMGQWLDKLLALQNRGVVTPFLQTNPLDESMVLQLHEYIANQSLRPVTNSQEDATAFRAYGQNRQSSAYSQERSYSRHQRNGSSYGANQALSGAESTVSSPVGSSTKILDTPQFHDIMD